MPKTQPLTLKATDEEKEIFKQDCQLWGKTSTREPRTGMASTRLKVGYIYFLQSWRCLNRLSIRINREALSGIYQDTIFSPFV